MPRFKEQAVCIRLIDFSETSQVVWLFTENLGLIRGLAKGSRRTSPGAIAKYSGGFELLTAGQVLGVTKPSTELAVITEWDLQQPNFQFRRNLLAQHLALYAADLVAAIMAEGDCHPQTYNALMTFYTQLNQPADPQQFNQALLNFQWQLLNDAGYKLELQTDVRLDHPLSSKRKTYTLDTTAGGFTCEQLPTSNAANLWRVRANTVALLREVAGESQADGTLNEDRPASIERANKLLCVYIRAILDRELPTMQVILDR